MLEIIGYFVGVNTAIQTLPDLWKHMESAPITIAFAIFAILILYYLPRKVSFFKNVSLGESEHTFFESNLFSKDFFSSKKRDPILKSRKNLIATFIYFVIFMVFVITFIALIFNLSTKF